jgi:hypothetical protein
MELGFTISGELRVARRFEEFPKALHDGYVATIGALTARLKGAILAAVPRRTGKLAGEIESTLYDNGDKGVRGRVAVTGDFAKAATLEYGSHKTVMVNLGSAGARGRQGHIKITAALMRQSDKIGAAFERHMNIDARRFLRGPRAELEAEIEASLAAVVTRAIADAP